MNFNRRHPVKPQKPEDTIESLSLKLTRISERIADLSNVDTTTISHVRALIQTAKYLLENSDISGSGEDEVSEDDDEDVATIEDIAVAQAVRSQSSSKPVLNLREKWSGDLPSSPPTAPKLTPKQEIERRQRIASMRDTVNGHSGGHPEDYEVTYDVLPSHICSVCRGTADVHNIDHHLQPEQTAEGTYRARILCDGTRAYMIVPGTPNEA